RGALGGQLCLEAVIVHAKQPDELLCSPIRVHHDLYPIRVREHRVWSGCAGQDDLVAEMGWERQVPYVVTMEVSELPRSEAKLGNTRRAVVRDDTGPRADGFKQPGCDWSSR